MAAHASASQMKSVVGDKKKAVGSRSPIFLAAMREKRQTREREKEEEKVWGWRPLLATDMQMGGLECGWDDGSVDEE